jgi:spermidine/putrescine transport system substrate-binding protein
MNRRDFLKGTAALASTVALGGLALGACGGQAEQSPSPKASSTLKAEVDGNLEYFGWTGFIEPSLVTGFEKEYGVTVAQNSYDNTALMIQKLAAGVPYDWVMTESDTIPLLSSAGVLQPIPHDQLKNWNQVLPYFRNPIYDPGATYSLDYTDGPTGIAWRTDKVDSSTMTGSYDDLWNHPEARGHIFLLNQMYEMIGMSLLHLGYPWDSSDLKQVTQAADALIKLKPMLGGFSNDDTGNLARGDAWIQYAYCGDVYLAMQQVKDPSVICWEMCKEGVTTAASTMSIAANAKHPGTALLFIDWMLDSKHSVLNVKYTGEPNGTYAGDAEYLELTKNVPFFKDTESQSIKNVIWKIYPTGARKALWDAAWRRVLTA